MALRVTAGTARGMHLRSPRGSGVRPTSERVRSALFSLMGPGMMEGGRVLDLYAGSGSLGVEALSRGASWADFVERSRTQCGTIRENLRTAGFADRARVYCVAVERALLALRGKYRCLFVDPPYDMHDLGRMMQRLAVAGLVEAGGIVVVEHYRGVVLAPRYDPLVLWKNRRYGDTCLSLYRAGGADGNGTVSGEL